MSERLAAMAAWAVAIVWGLVLLIVGTGVAFLAVSFVKVVVTSVLETAWGVRL